MSFSLTPQHSFQEITDISPGFLERHGIKLLMLDLDNTIAAYGEHSPSDTVVRWTEELKIHGIELYIVSNSVRKRRVASIAEMLGVGAVMAARKPSRKGILKAIAETGFPPESSALVGDQVFTDTLAANRAGIVSIIVKPRRYANPFLALRYALEAPFRAMCRNKNRN